MRRNRVLCFAPFSLSHVCRCTHCIVFGVMSLFGKSTTVGIALPVTPTLVEVLLRLASSPALEVRINVAGTLGKLGSTLPASAHDVVKAVATCLCQLMFDAELVVVAEALNSMFDVFVDERLDAVFAEIGAFDALKRARSDFRSKVWCRVVADCLMLGIRTAVFLPSVSGAVHVRVGVVRCKSACFVVW